MVYPTTKSTLGVLTLVASILLTSCSLIPKRVEFFQKDVPTYPAKTAPQVQAERQTAARLAEKTREVETVAAAEDCPLDVQKPAQEASQLAGALSTSLGPPTSLWSGPSNELAARLTALEAKRDVKLDRLEGKLDKLEGKPVEGTGKIQVPYLLWVAIVIGGVALFIALAHAGLNIAAMFNPVAAGVKGGAELAWKASTQLVKGGGTFIASLKDSKLSQEAQDEVKTLFFTAHKTAQDSDVKQIVSTLPGAVAQKP